MSDDLTDKKAELEKNLHDLLKLVNELEPSQSVKFYENLMKIV